MFKKSTFIIVLSIFALTLSTLACGASSHHNLLNSLLQLKRLPTRPLGMSQFKRNGSMRATHPA